MLQTIERPALGTTPFMARTFGEVLTEVRELRGLSKYALSKKSGVSHVMIGDLETGKRNPSREMVGKLSSALEVEPDDMFLAAGFVPVASSQEIVYEPIADTIPVPEGYQDVDDPILKVGATRVAQRAYAEYIEAVRAIRGETGTGFGKDRYDGQKPPRIPGTEDEEDTEYEAGADEPPARRRP